MPTGAAPASFHVLAASVTPHRGERRLLVRTTEGAAAVLIFPEQLASEIGRDLARPTLAASTVLAHHKRTEAAS